MIYPSADKLESWGSKYALVTLAAKRAKQVKSGSPPLITTDSRNPLTIALEEIAAGKVTCVVAENDIVLTTVVEPEVAQLLAIPEETEEETETASEEARIDQEEEVLFTEDEEEAEEEHEDWEEEEVEEETEEEEEPLLLGVVDDDETDTDEESPAIDEVIGDAPEPKRRGRRKAKADVEEAEVLGLPDDFADVEDTEDEEREEE